MTCNRLEARWPSVWHKDSRGQCLCVALALTHKGSARVFWLSVSGPGVKVKLCNAELNIVCPCCSEALPLSPCPSCRYSTGFHLCRRSEGKCASCPWRGLPPRVHRGGKEHRGEGTHSLSRNEHNERGHHLWRKGTLHAGSLDVQRVLFNLHRSRFFIILANGSYGDCVGGRVRTR